jgi:GntR family transcriptional regulator / MocR family aminotransferase
VAPPNAGRLPGVDLHLDRSSGGDLTTRLYRELREAVRDGRLRPRDRLPPTRELATQLDVSRGTVATAYERLVAEGFLTARVGAGTYVADTVLATGARGRRRTGAVSPRRGWTVIPAPVTMSDEVPYDFSVGVPDPGLFPFDTWRRLMASEMRVRANSPGRYADPAGHPGLREAVSRYVGVSRSVLCDADDVLVTNGTQHALDLVGRVVLEPGDTVAVENPGYPPAATLLATSGMRVAPVPVDDEGLVVQALPARARLVYVTPSHQFPTGVAMSLRRRMALVEWAQQHDALVVEDDYDSEFRFSARPLEPLVSLDPAGRVCYVGSFSKTMLPAVRLGFVVSPPSLRSALRASRQLSDGFSPVPTQAALARFIDDGMLARHVRKASSVYARRRTAVLAALEPVAGLSVVPSSAGLHVCVRMPGGPAGVAQRVVSAARRVGVAVESLNGYYLAGQVSGSTDVEGLAVGYGAVADDRVDEGLRRLVRVLRRETTVS